VFFPISRLVITLNYNEIEFFYLKGIMDFCLCFKEAIMGKVDFNEDVIVVGAMHVSTKM
jgi:hypothetical protein